MTAESAPAPQRRQGKRTQQTIHEIALRSFADRGYHGMSLRQLAADVGIEVGSLYRHFSSKEELLFTLIHTATEAFLERLLDAMNSAGDDAVRRLHALVEETARTHAADRDQSLLGMLELRELTPEHYASALAQRDRAEELFKSSVVACREVGYYPGDVDVSVTAQFLASAGSSIAVWYREGGRLSPERIATMAADFAVPLPSGTS